MRNPLNQLKAETVKAVDRLTKEEEVNPVVYPLGPLGCLHLDLLPVHQLLLLDLYLYLDMDRWTCFRWHLWLFRLRLYLQL